MVEKTVTFKKYDEEEKITVRMVLEPQDYGRAYKAGIILKSKFLGKELGVALSLSHAMLDMGKTEEIFTCTAKALYEKCFTGYTTEIIRKIINDVHMEVTGSATPLYEADVNRQIIDRLCKVFKIELHKESDVVLKEGIEIKTEPLVMSVEDKKIADDIIKNEVEVSIIRTVNVEVTKDEVRFK